MNFKSVKLLGGLSILFLIGGFSVSLFEKRVVGLTGVLTDFALFSTVLKISTLIVGGALFLISLQTLYCRGKGKLDVILHVTAGLSLITLILIPFTWKTKTFYLYPYSYVEVDKRVIGLKGIEFGKFGITGNFFIEQNRNRTEGKVSFNRPLLSEKGFLWIEGVREFNGVPAVEVKFSPFSAVPILFVTLFGLFTILLGVRLLKGGKNVHSGRGEGAPETDR